MTDPTTDNSASQAAEDSARSSSTDPARTGPSSLDTSREASCRLVLELLPEAVGGDLDEGTELAIARHVSGCHSCGREWASLRRAHRALTSLSESGWEGGSRMDDAFFAELHQDIVGEVRHREQLEKDQRVFQKARSLPESPQPDRVALSSVSGAWSRFRAPVLHVASLAAAVLLGILIGKQFEGESAPEDLTDNAVIKVRSDSERGLMRDASDSRSPRIHRVDGQVTDEKLRTWLDRLMKNLNLPQPVVPNAAMPELPMEPSELEKREGEKHRSSKKGEDF